MDLGLRGTIPQGECRREGDQDTQSDLKLLKCELHGANEACFET